jgi:lysophospholipase L1-like esterase
MLPRMAAAASDGAPTLPSVALAVVGDSISEADSRDFSAGRLGPGSWVSHAVGGELRFAGGWAVSGALTSQMARGAWRVPADVLVILAGTNDVARGIPFPTCAANLRSIAGTVGVGRVVISTIPPIDQAPDLATGYNEQLRALAAVEGWEFVDAMAGIRSGDRFADGMSWDGVHPTVAAAAVIGGAIRALVLGG